MKRNTLLLAIIFFSQIGFAQDKVLDVLKTEVSKNMEALQSKPVPPYYLSYRIYDTDLFAIQASLGELEYRVPRKTRYLHATLRVGSHELDNTREIKGNFGRGGNDAFTNHQIPIEDDPLALQRALWSETDKIYKDALKQYENVKANVAVTVGAEDKSDDFTKEQTEKYFEKPLNPKDIIPDTKKWEEKVKKISRVFSENRDIISGGASFQVEITRKYFADSDGAQIAENVHAYRISMNISTTADDGMNLPLYKSYFAYDLKDFPSDEKILADAREMSKLLSDLRKAPVADSYSGPALMTAKASGVFFHEIFGHRIEGARLKQSSDAQTFKKMIGQLVLPEDFSIIFDPQIKEYKKMPLAGSYVFDDEGIRGQRVTIVENGILKSFLMSRTPIDGFPNSNGHGRGMIYYTPVTRQSNMLIESNNAKSEAELRKILIEEAKRQNKPYAYLFDEVSGGFTSTGRYMPNAFNVTPLVVYRIYTDGRPDELVRGVDLVGTPLAMFSQIAACGNDYDVFNGYCGAESGSVPVSCVSPSLFVKMIETQKKAKSQSLPPLLERP